MKFRAKKVVELPDQLEPNVLYFQKKPGDNHLTITYTSDDGTPERLDIEGRVPILFADLDDDDFVLVDTASNGKRKMKVSALATYVRESDELTVKRRSIELTGASYVDQAFIGLSIHQIRTRFRINIDGAELLTRQGVSVTNTGTGEVNLGYNYTGTAYLIDLGA